MPYGTIDHCFWMNGAAKNLLNDREKLALLYLISSPHSNIIGFYRLPLVYMAHDLQWTQKDVEKAMKRLCAEETGPLILYDLDAEVVLIPSYLKYNPLWKGNRETGAISQVEDLPPTPLHHEFKAAMDLHAPGLRKLATVVESVNTSRSPLRLFEQSRESEGRHIDTVIDTDVGIEDWFKTFWKIYPKKRGKGAAEKSFAKKVTSQVIYDAVIAGLEKHLGCADWEKDGGQFIPNPATWLNQRRWEDEPEPASQGNRAGGHDPAIYALDDAAGKVWAVVVETMKAEISYSSFETWFKEAVPFALSDGCLKIAVPEPFTKGGLERRYKEMIEEIATKQRGEPTTLVIEVG